jgi:SWI/SNF chromatin-remodeling complex subunit SWI1
MSNAPTPFQHLQTSNNATPSPTVQQMNFNQGGGPQRVSTASPSPFSPQQGAPHVSPGPSDHANRVGTPHDSVQGFMANMSNPSFGAGFNQPQFNPNIANGMHQMGMNQQLNMAQQQMGMSAAQRNYQMQLQAQARHLAQTQARNAGMAMPGQGMPNAINQMQPGAFGPPKPKSPEDFIKGLQAFMAARGRTVDLSPVICGRPLQLLQLYGAVVKSGGSQKISKMQQWGLLAQQFGFPQPQQAQAAQELQMYWMNNLAPYEAAWQMSQHKQRMAAQAAIQNQMQSQLSPTRETQHNQDPNQPGHQRNQSDLIKMSAQLQNGFMPSGPQNQSMTPQHRSSLSKQFDPSQMPGVSPQKPIQAEATKPVEAEPEPTMPIKKPIEDPFKPEVIPASRYHGPINVEEIYGLGQHITETKPTIPTFRELGVIDVHALTMAIKSGMHGETRVALDTLVTLSTESQFQLSLNDCDDLMETLIDCAQDQVDFLAEHAAEVSDEMLMTPYEDLIRLCRAEAEGLQDVPDFGTVEYDLDRAADRLICITTLIRNFSFYEANFAALGQPEILKLLSHVIRNLGTKEMVLRSNRNTLDFMKDVIIYLSNLSTSLNLPGKEEALCLIHFLLAFAPTPTPTATGADRVSFTMYTPNIHKYMPSAVDSLAKLLARDEPNRTYYKAIFSADATSTPPYDLLTRTFGLAIAPIPASSSHTRAIIEVRKPFLLQGMLAAEILAGLVPGSDHHLARSWLDSEDGFAVSLLRLVTLLSADKSTQMANPNAQRHPHQHPHHPQRNHPEQDANAYGAITTRAVAVLRTLVQKARVVDEEGKVVLPHGIMPRKEKLLGAMIEENIDPGILRMLCVYAGLED